MESQGSDDGVVASGSSMTNNQNSWQKKDKIVVGKFSELTNKSLVEPWITEKSHDLMANNKYVFKVNKDKDKRSVKLAIEDLYSVTVMSINMINVSPKARVFGRKTGWKTGFKKAIVTLKEGDKIEMFEGVSTYNVKCNTHQV